MTVLGSSLASMSELWFLPKREIPPSYTRPQRTSVIQSSSKTVACSSLRTGPLWVYVELQPRTSQSEACGICPQPWTRCHGPKEPRRTFAAAVSELTDSGFPDWLVTGPRTTRWLAGALEKLNFTPLQRHHWWRALLELDGDAAQVDVTGSPLKSRKPPWCTTRCPHGAANNVQERQWSQIQCLTAPLFWKKTKVRAHHSAQPYSSTWQTDSKKRVQSSRNEAAAETSGSWQG